MTRTTRARIDLTPLDATRTIWARTRPTHARPTGRRVTIAAFSTPTETDPAGRWTYDHVDGPGTPWTVTDRRSDTDTGPFHTLKAARAWTYQQDHPEPAVTTAGQSTPTEKEEGDY